ncbi:MAG: hypothetical protein P9X24_11590 [Candidatus Hatepunaea meridiana]|nr:hypothetical protein [Candidatus Hatepunaea meridiana]
MNIKLKHQTQKPKAKSLKPVSLDILTLSLTLIIIGCTQKPELPFKDNLLDKLIDTVYTNQNREVLLTNLTGGYYYDNAFRNQDRGEYGFSCSERKLIAGWHILDFEGNRIDKDTDVCIITPDRIKRQYLNGVTEKVECPPNRIGLLLTIDPGKQSNIILRPLIDIRLLNRSYKTDEKPTDYQNAVFDRKTTDCQGAVPDRYESIFLKDANTLIITRTNIDDGWVAITVSKGNEIIEVQKHQQLQHPQGKLIGRIPESSTYIPVDVIHHSRRLLQIAFGWGNSEEQATEIALEILNNQKEWRKERRQWMEGVLNPLTFRCSNKTAERAFAWARLTLAGLITNKDKEQFLFTGIPYAPYPDGWFTMLSIPGITSMRNNPGLALEIMDAIIVRQNIDTSSSKYGMFPGKIQEDNIEYRIPEIAGLTAIIYQRIEKYIVEPDTVRGDSLAAALVRDLMGTIKHRLHQGLVVSEADEHFLWDSQAAPKRYGATLEAQVLLGEVRSFLKQYKRLNQIADISHTLLQQSGYLISKLGENFIETPFGIAIDASGNYEIPMPQKSLKSVFSDVRHVRWADRLVYYEMNGIKTLLPGKMDSTNRVSLPFALDWYSIGSKSKLFERHRYKLNGLIADAGFHSLAINDVNYQADHIYQIPDAPTGTSSRGDVLLWTCGELARFYMSTKQQGRLQILAETLSDKIFTTGIVGGLPEAEDASRITHEGSFIGNSLHSTSLANYIWLMAEGVLGIEPMQKGIQQLHPNIPSSWRKYYFDVAYGDGRYTLERKSETQWIISQNGIEPTFRAVLEIVLPNGRQVRQSVRLYPGDRISVSFFTIGDKNWKTEVKPL